MRLNGERDIISYLGWTHARFQKHRSAMQEAGVLLYEFRGVPRKKHLWTLTELLQRWLVANAQNKKVF